MAAGVEAELYDRSTLAVQSSFSFSLLFQPIDFDVSEKLDASLRTPARMAARAD